MQPSAFQRSQEAWVDPNREASLGAQGDGSAGRRGWWLRTVLGVREVWAEPHFAAPPPRTGPLPSPCPCSQGSLREGGLEEGGPPTHFPVPTCEDGCFFNLRPRTRSSLLLLTHSRSASARTHSSCWYGWWTSSGESFRPGDGGRGYPAGRGHLGVPAGAQASLQRSGPPVTFHLHLLGSVSTEPCPRPWTGLTPACFNMTPGENGLSPQTCPGPAQP